MSKIKEIEAYIARTNIKQGVGAAPSRELLEIYEACEGLNAIFLAFHYGRAKGYRAGKAEERRKQNNG